MYSNFYYYYYVLKVLKGLICCQTFSGGIRCNGSCFRRNRRSHDSTPNDSLLLQTGRVSDPSSPFTLTLRFRVFQGSVTSFPLHSLGKIVHCWQLVTKCGFGLDIRVGVSSVINLFLNSFRQQKKSRSKLYFLKFMVLFVLSIRRDKILVDLHTVRTFSCTQRSRRTRTLPLWQTTVWSVGPVDKTPQNGRIQTKDD